MTHIFQAVGGFICREGGNFWSEGILCTWYPGGNIYLCNLAQGSSDWRSNATRWDWRRGSIWKCVSVNVHLPTTLGCCIQKKRMGREEEGGLRRQFCIRRFRERCSTQSTGSGIAVLGVNPRAAQCSPGFFEPPLFNVGNDRTKKTNPNVQIAIYYPFQCHHCHVWLRVLKIIITSDIHCM